ncbi:MAG: hydrogenase maturation nickel metallochaperone HypA [Aquificae bacterium]|nr:hydrogenase maturation nickel metallochaperone HypA [Aquificota bacterium]
MHEFSIVQSLLALIEQEAAKHGANKVSKVVLAVGPLSGVEVHLLKQAFEAFKEGTVAAEAELEVEQTKLRVFCRSCGREYEKEELNLLCPACGTNETELRGGDELLLKSLELLTEESREES